MRRVNTKDTKGGRKEAQRKLIIRFFLFGSMLLAGCGANDNVLRSGKGTPSQPATLQNAFVEDLASMRTAGFNFIYVLRRKDGEPMDNEDRGVIRLNTAVANRRFSGEEGRSFIIGSNPPIPAGNLAALNERFAVEDHSPPSTPDANVNANK